MKIRLPIRYKSYAKDCFRIVFLLWLLNLSGCKERQLASPTPQMDIEPRFWIRVLLLENAKSCHLGVSTPFTVWDAEAQTAEARFTQSGTLAEITISAGRIAISGRSFSSEQITIVPDKPYIFSLNGNDYRGKLKLMVDSGGDSFDAVNIVPLEPYLAGVVGAEMPNYWEPAALQAQAIAARTYCLYCKRRFGRNRHWDVRRTQASQVYLGVAAESAQVWRAVNRTYGKVMASKDSDSNEGIFPAYYSSTCGGHTENSKNVFGDSFEALVGVPCPYCKDVAKPSFFSWPMVQFDKGAVTKNLLRKYPKLKHLGRITGISAVNQSDYEGFSRLTSVKLVGSTGKSDFLRAEDLRLSIDPTGRKLKSASFQIVDMGDKWGFLSGRGFGHSVGMCQCGAEGMARKGYSTGQILSYYYPGSRIVSIY